MIRASALLLVLLGAVGCGETSAERPPPHSAAPAGSVSAPVFTREAGPETAAPTGPLASDLAGEERAVADEAPGEDEASADEGPAVEEGLAAEEAPAAAEEEPLPEVEVRNVGMHIGGEENTSAQKRPIRAVLAKHYDAMKRCYAKAVDPPKETTFGVDIRIDGEGGVPKVSNPRNGLDGDDVEACMLGVFEAVEFPRQPRGQDRMVSYSIRFRRP